MATVLGPTGQRSYASFALFLSLLLFAHSADASWRLEAGRATTNSTFTIASFRTVTFQTPFDVTPVVVVLATNSGSDPSDVRIRNITTTGFEIAPLEPTGNDGPHVAMTIDYVAMEPGVHVLPTGETVVAGLHTTSTVQRSGVVGGPSGYDTVAFGATLAATASVVASIQTMNSETGSIPSGPSVPWLNPVMRNATASSIQMALERSEVSAGSVLAETIGYIAFPSGANDTFLDSGGVSTLWSASTTSDSIVGWDNGCITHTFSSTAFAAARVVASKVSRDGGDGGWLRRCSLSSTQIGLQVDEDIANDTERSHTTETASVLAFSRDFHAFFDGVLTAVKTVEGVEDPVNGVMPNAYQIPGARIRYTVVFESVGNLPIDPDTVDFVDTLPSDVRLVVDDIAGAGTGPVLFSDRSPSSGLTYSFAGLASASDDVEFSSDGGLTFTYTPVIGPDGTDPAVTHLRVRPQGSFSAQGAGAPPGFEIAFDAIID